MAVQQLAVFVENVPGRLKKVAQVLADNQVNMRAITLADTSDFGVVRMLVDDNEKALKILEDNRFVAKLSNILAVKMGDEPGQLLTLLGEFEANNINIEYMYAFKVGQINEALMLFKVDKEDLAQKVLIEAGHHVFLEQSDVIAMI